MELIQGISGVAASRRWGGTEKILPAAGGERDRREAAVEGPSDLTYKKGRPREGAPFCPIARKGRCDQAISFLRLAFLRSFGSRIALRRRTVCGVTSTISSSSM